MAISHENITAWDGIIEAAHATMVIQHIFVGKQARVLHLKEHVKKTDKAVLFVNGNGRHVTDVEWIEALEAGVRRKRDDESTKSQHVVQRLAKKAATAELETKWQEMKEVHQKAVEKWEENCHEHLSKGVKRKDLPKKPVKPKKPVLQTPDDDSDEDNEELSQHVTTD